jgi:NAD-dependent dihydropyrimidine dehydrogenase PreA subunit
MISKLIKFFKKESKNDKTHEGNNNGNNKIVDSKNDDNENIVCHDLDNIWGPTIDYDKCKNCISCYKFCNYGVYEVENGRVVVKYKDKCVDGCSMCLDVCRYGALSFPNM